jgi:hypothetical protein
MYEGIQGAFQALQVAVADFNQDWPSWVVEGVCWDLPLLTERKTPDLIQASRLEGRQAIEAAIGALGAFERDLGQAPGTVMRLPGIFLLSRSVLDQVRSINRLKDALARAIESTRLELGLVAKARPTIMRKALGQLYNTKQLLRHIQAFDGTPRLVVFTWAGHTSGGERIPVGQIREQLELAAESRADREGIAINNTAEYQELRALVNMGEGEYLLKHKPVAPHPRAMFYLSESTRYTAMIHANLPAFVLAGEDGECRIRPLKDFDRNARGAQRPDVKTRIEAVPGKDLFIPSRKRNKPVPHKLEVATTYGE